MEKIWQLYPKMPNDFREQHPKHSRFILQLLYNRGLKTADDLKWFLAEEPLDFFDPFLFKDMSRAVELVIKHLKQGGRIMIYGDYDADGITSSALLYDILTIFKARVDFYLPDRVSEGYGLNRTAIDEIKKNGFSLIITVDNGIRSKDEVDYIKSLGLDIIITDHHAYPEDEKDWPDSPTINPADASSGYPFKYLAGVGVAFKLVSALIEKSKLSGEQKKILLARNLDLVAIGTITDMVSLVGENRLLVRRGLEVLNSSQRIGLLELIKVAGLNAPLNSFSLGFQLGPRLNAASRIQHANSALKLLISSDPIEARRLAEELDNNNLARQKVSEEVLTAADSQIDPDHLPSLIVIKDFSDQTFNEGVIGLVAGKLAEKYYRPVFIIVKTEEQAVAEDGQSYHLYKGSGRSIEEFNLVAALEDNQQYLYKYGGHPMAGGFSVLGEEKTLAFISHLEKMGAERLKQASLQAKIKVDCELDFSDIDQQLVESINGLSPFGQNNPSPKFVTFNVKVIDLNQMGSKGQHIKFKFLNHNDKEMKTFWGVAFGASRKYSHLRPGDNVDLVYSLEFNFFNGAKDIQLKIIDLKKI